MRRIVWAVLSVLVATCVIAFPAFAQNKKKPLLKDVTEIDISIKVSDVQAARTCNLDTSAIRATVVNEAAATGLKITDTAHWTIYVMVVPIANSQICFSAVSTESSFYGDFLKRGGDEVIFTAVQINSYVSSRSSPAMGHLASVQDAVRTDIQTYISEWREVNSGSPLVRQTAPAPAAGRGGASLSIVDIRDAQRVLQRLGYYAGAIDGTNGPGTRSAIQQFQRSNGLVVTGDLNEATLSAIREK